MTLNKVIPPEYLTIDINGKIIGYKPWTNKDEKNYLLYSENLEQIKFNNIYDLLIKPKLFNWEVNLSDDEKKILSLEVRKKSVGSTFSISYECNECNNINEVELDFDEVIQYRESNFYPIILDNMTFSFKDIEIPPIKNDNLQNEIEEKFEIFIHSIKEIKIYESYLDFDLEELRNFFNEMEIDDYNYLLEEFEKMYGYFKMETKRDCLICGNKNTIDLLKLDEFLPNIMLESDLNTLYEYYTNMKYYGNYTIGEIDNMLPLEREIYYAFLHKLLEENKPK